MSKPSRPISSLKESLKQPLLLEGSLVRVCSGNSEHIVQFYETDDFLVGSVATFLGAGLGSGEAAIAIGTKAHRDAIALQLQANGIDLETVQSRGQYVALDAADCLSKFMEAGLPDTTRFMQVIGTLISKTSAGGRGLRVFGEMVSLLWQDGNETGVMRLEELWNELLKKHAVYLLCAYRIEDFGESSSTAAFAQICEAHSRVLPSESVVLEDSEDSLLRKINSLNCRHPDPMFICSNRQREDNPALIHACFTIS